MKTVLLIIIPIIVGVSISIQPVLDYLSADTHYSKDVDPRIVMASDGFAIASNINVYSVTVEDEIQGMSITTEPKTFGTISMDDPLPILQRLFPDKVIGNFSVVSKGEEIPYALENGKLSIDVKDNTSILIVGITSPELVAIQPEIGKTGSYLLDKFKIKYSIDGAFLENIIHDSNATMIEIFLDDSHGGTLSITIPRDLIDAKIGESDDDFFVLVDGIAVPYTEIASKHERNLTIDFDMGTKTIQIIGTNPDF